MRILSLIKRYGIIGMIENVLFKSFRLFGFHNFQVLRLLRLMIVKSHVPVYEGHEIRQLSWQDFVRCKHNDTERFSDILNSQIKNRFQEENGSGELCFGIINEDIIVAYAWISLYYYPRSKIKLPLKSAFIYDDYTHPNYRGRGFHKKLIEYRIGLLAGLGYDTAYASVDLFNKASLKGFIKAGFSESKKYMMWTNRNGRVISTFNV